MSQYYFTADFHLWHTNILRLSNRKFASIEEHNGVLQSNINTLLKPKDILVILGDLAFGSPSRLVLWLDGLVTKNLYAVWGNHDDTAKRLAKREPGRFKRTGDILELKLPSEDCGSVDIVCCHYAMRVWNRSHHGAYQLYGHSHGSLPDNPNLLSMDVGVDTNDYSPWSLSNIVAKLSMKKYNPVDHHIGIRELSHTTQCVRCGHKKGIHKAGTLNCPVGASLRFHEVQFFAP